MTRIRWTPAAASDLESVKSYLDTNQPHWTRRTVAALYDAVASLKESPLRGRTGRIEGTRELVHPTLPYIVIYRQKSDAIEVLHIVHTSRNYP